LTSLSCCHPEGICCCLCLLPLPFSCHPSPQEEDLLCLCCCFYPPHVHRHFDRAAHSLTVRSAVEKSASPPRPSPSPQRLCLCGPFKSKTLVILRSRRTCGRSPSTVRDVSQQDTKATPKNKMQPRRTISGSYPSCRAVILRWIRSKSVHAYDTTENAGDFTLLHRQQRRSNHRLLPR
jgi:hypothetical protein